MNKENIIEVINNLICEWEQEHKGKWFVKEFIKDLKQLKKEVLNA